MYAGGDFTTVGGQTRNHIAAIDAISGNAASWNPNANGQVHAVEVSGNTVYVGGEFTAINGVPRIGFAALPAAHYTTTTAITDVAPSPSTVGQAITVSYSVTSADGTPTGNMTVSDGVASCTATVAAGSCQLTPTSAGAKTLTATYAGDINFIGSSGTRTHTVNSTATVTLTSSANPSQFGQAVIFTATVNGQNPTGAVAFTADGNPIANCGAVTLNGGSAQCTATGLSGGNHAIVAAYGGDANNPAASSNPLTQTVQNAFTGASPSGQGNIATTFSGGGDNCNLTQAALVGLPAAPPAGFGFPYGLLRFALGSGCISPVTVQVTYPAALPADAAYWKYGRTADNATPHWYRLTTATVAGTTVTFTLTDGGLGDDDLTADGSITDDGGVGVPAGAPTDIPTLSEWAMLLLMSLLLGFGGWRLRQSRSL